MRNATKVMLAIVMCSPACTAESTDGPEVDLRVCDLAAGPFSADVDHPYFPLVVGSLHVFSGEEEGKQVRLEYEVLDRTENVSGVVTRVVEERAFEDEMLHEVADNFFAQAADGTVCYFGETTDFYENGMIVDHEGAWRAGEQGALPGMVMPAAPELGMFYAQERAEGVSEDHAEVVEIGESFAVPAGTFEDTLDTEETSPLDPGVVESKRYGRDVGLIVSGPLLLETY